MHAKRILLAATSSIIICAVFYCTAVAATDIKGHWAEGSIAHSVTNGYINGYKDGTFRPDAPVTRAEFVALANRTMNFSGAGSVPFTDVVRSNWYYDDISTAVRQGYINGYEDYTFRPQNPITREMAAMIAYNILHLNPDERYASYFSDANKLTYSKGAVGAAVKAGVLAGYNDGEFKPERRLSRAEAVVIINRVAAKKFDESLDVSYTYQNYYTNQSIFDWTLPEERLNYQSSDLTTTTNLNTDDYYRMYNGNYGTETMEIFNGSVYYDPKHAGTVKNITVNGDFNISSLVSTLGPLTLENVIIRGKFVVYSVDNITLRNCEINEIEYNSSFDYATITATGDTQVSVTTLCEGVRLHENNLSGAGFREIIIDRKYREGDPVRISGDTRLINILGSNADIILERGIAEYIDINSQSNNTNIEVQPQARIRHLEVAAKCYIGGAGRIDLARVTADNAVFDLRPLNVSGNRNPVYTSTVTDGNYTDDYTREMYPVTITIRDLYGNVQPGVSVKLGIMGEYITDQDGKVTFPYVEKGTYVVQISKPFVNGIYEEINVFNAAVNKTIMYDTTVTYNVAFAVEAFGLPAQDAEVILSGERRLTSLSGGAEFLGYKPGLYSYTVTYGSLRKNGTIEVVDGNVTEPVSLTAADTIYDD